MDASSIVVIKVKCGDVLRRFSAQIVNNELNLNMNGLKKRIVSLFNFTPDAELVLTYIDEDNDIVTLVDDDDLRDVVRQTLNPLRITVKLNPLKEPKYDRSSGSSDPLTLPEVRLPLLDPGSRLSEIVMNLPVPLRGPITEFSADLIDKTPSSAPSSTRELLSFIRELASSYIGKISEFQATESVSLRTTVPEQRTQDSLLYKADPAAVIGVLTSVLSQLLSKMVEEGKILFHGSNMENSSVGGNDVVAADDSENVEATQNGNNSSPHTESDHVGKFGKSSTNSSNVLSAADCIHAPKDASSKPGEIKTALNSAGASAPSPSDGEKSDNRNTALRNRLSPCSSCGPGGDSLRFSDSYGPSPLYECPFSGMPLDNVSTALPSPAYEVSPLRKNSNGDIFHCRVRCDGCGVQPITGPRFKSKVKADYDLCGVCFEKMGNSADYIRMDRPMVHPPRFLFKGLQDSWPRDQAAMLLHSHRDSKAKHGSSRLDSRFIHDVNIVDGTVMPPATPFTKIWRMRNNGSAAWAPKTQLVWIGGDKLSNALTFEVEIPSAGLLVDQEIDVAVDLISPQHPGRYVSYWRMASSTGRKFGQRVWVLIQVDASVKEAPHETIRNLNLNLPPLSSISSVPTDPEIVDINPEPAIANTQPLPDNSEKMVELEEPVVDLNPNVDQELKFPINNSLLVGGGTSPFPSVPRAAPFPVRDPSTSNAPFVAPPLLEEKLLKELEEMGFKHVDLNRDILRMKDYDLEQTVDELCAVADWDHLLTQLQDMGFHDRETNQMLLKKNNGSIKRAVMDLVTGEKKMM